MKLKRGSLFSRSFHVASPRGKREIGRRPCGWRPQDPYRGELPNWCWYCIYGDLSFFALFVRCGRIAMQTELSPQKEKRAHSTEYRIKGSGSSGARPKESNAGLVRTTSPSPSRTSRY
ncbi:hypothetical protein CI102_14023 [Trichoderma harzianum]|nr:hypothetical protein CI102_14023 [Trichoderma harzianum]